MNKFMLIFILVNFSFGACQTDKKAPIVDEKWQNTAQLLTVKLDKVKLREEPSISAKIIDTLGIGNSLFDLKKTSKELTLAHIDSVMYWEPWLKVKTEEGLQGWVYAGGIDFSKKENLLVQKRAMALLGEVFHTEIRSYQQKHETLLTDSDFAKNFRLGINLRDSMVSIIDIFLEKLPVDVGLPDFFWLEKIIPGFIPQLVAEGSRYYLFADYKYWETKSSISEGQADDDYLQTCFAIFPTDSIEYFFPAWTLQTWDYGGHSLLGRGIHLKILNLLDKSIQKSELFQPEFLELKQQILDDITVDYITYWESKKKIIEEVDQIFLANLSILNKPDKIALEMRRAQFEAAKKNNIALDLFHKE